MKQKMWNVIMVYAHLWIRDLCGTYEHVYTWCGIYIQYICAMYSWCICIVHSVACEIWGLACLWYHVSMYTYTCVIWCGMCYMWFNMVQCWFYWSVCIQLFLPADVTYFHLELNLLESHSVSISNISINIHSKIVMRIREDKRLHSKQMACQVLINSLYELPCFNVWWRRGWRGDGNDVIPFHWEALKNLHWINQAVKKMVPSSNTRADWSQKLLN